MSAATIELMQAMPIFGAIREETLRFLVARTDEVRVPAGACFFREGDAADGMYVLEVGRVEVLKAWQDREQCLRTLGPGDCFGEMALMDLGSRSASVRALEDCIALILRPEHLQALFEYDPVQFALLQMNMGREVCRRLRVTDELLFQAEMGSTPRPPEALPRAT
jgi:CRP/FNR family transcriptional regulator, cyclic AMP receptor protein